MSQDQEYLEFKIVMIGAVAVGKTAIANWLQFRVFEEDYQPTIGAGYVPYKTKYDGQPVELQIWDTAGMERYRSLGSIYYRESHAAIIVFDQTCKESAVALEKWLGNFRQTITEPCPIFIAANKNDIAKKEVDINEVKKWCDDHRFPLYITSAKTGEGIEKMFTDLTETIVKKYEHSKPQNQRELRTIKDQNGCC